MEIFRYFKSFSAGPFDELRASSERVEGLRQSFSSSCQKLICRRAAGARWQAVADKFLDAHAIGTVDDFQKGPRGGFYAPGGRHFKGVEIGVVEHVVDDVKARRVG